MILRANAGDWIEITLHNKFISSKPIRYDDYPSVPVDLVHKPSDRVSLHPQLLKYNPIHSSGLNVGRNGTEQTITSGEKIQYLWYADKEYGTCLLSSFGDLRNHRHHGLFGAIIIEPKDSLYYDELLPLRNNHKEQAVISAPCSAPFREFVLFAQNGIRLLDANDKVIKTTETGEPGGHGGPDHEDTGEKGYNYRSERFFNRLSRIPVIGKIFSSKIHGDPATPILKANCGERVIIRLLMPGDKPRNIWFTLHGHTWKAQIGDRLSRVISTQGAISVGGVYNIELEGGANRTLGDYLYRSGSLKWDVESGMWGILRIKKGVVHSYCQHFICKAGEWWKKPWWVKQGFNPNWASKPWYDK